VQFVLEERALASGPQNLRVTILLKVSKSAGAKSDVPKINYLRVRASAAPVVIHSLCRNMIHGSDCKALMIVLF
jgi:hypothetical protein